MTQRKFFGFLCIGLNSLGLILKLFEYKLLVMLTTPPIILHILLYIVGAFWLSEEASRNKRMISALLTCIAAGYVAFSSLITLRAVTPIAILNFLYLPLAVVLYVTVLREGKGKGQGA